MILCCIIVLTLPCQRLSRWCCKQRSIITTAFLLRGCVVEIHIQKHSFFARCRSLAAPAVLVVTVGQGVFRGMQDMRTPLAVTLTANVINLGLDILLIVGLGWGVSGAATATTVAEWTAAAAYLGLLWRRREELGGAPALQSALQGGSVKQVAAEFAPFLSAGGAVLLRTAALLGTKTLASATAARLGPVPIASHQVRVFRVFRVFRGRGWCGYRMPA